MPGFRRFRLLTAPLLLAHRDVEDLDTAQRQIGATGYLRKPFDLGAGAEVAARFVRLHMV